MLPPLRERKDDIHLLFRKFASDFAHKYKMPAIKLDDNAVELLIKYRWSGNIRQLRNIAEQISVLETNRNIAYKTLQGYLPTEGSQLPALIKDKKSESDFSNEREILYKVLFDMRSDLNDLKKLTLELMQHGNAKVQETSKSLIQRIYNQNEEHLTMENLHKVDVMPMKMDDHSSEQEEFDDDEDQDYLFAETVEEEETLRLDEKEIELIKKALERNKGKRKAAADELGISERTLYRKIKQFDL
jgi:DNA-binding NtrC family response regulator